MFLWQDISIGFRNPIKFVNQWSYLPLICRLRAVIVWTFWIWIRNDCDVWIKYGIRIFGVEIQYTKYLI